MSLEGLDLVPLSRSLSQLAESDGDRADAFLERLEVVEVPAESGGAGIRLRREEGFALALVRGEKSFMATGDSLAPDDLLAALRQVARSRPQAAYPAPDLRPPEWPPVGIDRNLLRFPSALNRALRRRLVAFPLRLGLRRHRRWLQVVGPRLSPDGESELYFSIEVTTPFGRRGLLAAALDRAVVDDLADSLAGAFEAREADPPEPFEGTVALSPQATAIFLHEAVAHALEADTLASGGSLEAAIGLRLGPESLSVLDDPGSAPAGVRRTTDDEGSAVERRWLLREGVVEQPLADLYWSQRSALLLPGAGRRGGRADPATPRSSHLSLLPGEATMGELLAGDGLWVPQFARGTLSRDVGVCRLHAPYGVRFESGSLGEPVGPFTIEGRLAELLEAIEAIGREPVATGAGWCAKGRQRLPVWATAPAVRLERVRVVS